MIRIRIDRNHSSIFKNSKVSRRKKFEQSHKTHIEILINHDKLKQHEANQGLKENKVHLTCVR